MPLLATAGVSPQGCKLSAKLTEGLLYLSIDKLTNSGKISFHLIVGNTNDFQTISFQKSSAFCIFQGTFILIVLRSIQFNHEFCFCAIEINNIFPQYLLS